MVYCRKVTVKVKVKVTVKVKVKVRLLKLELKLKLKLKLTSNSICVRLGVISRVLYFFSSGSYFCVEWFRYAW